MAIYQDLVDHHGFASLYNSVKRFVATIKRRDPERFDVLESAPGEEAQVDFGEGALTLGANGKYRRPFLFVMTLKYSGKSFRKVVWKTSQEIWARLHEEAFRTFGGSVRYVVLDNLNPGGAEHVGQPGDPHAASGVVSRTDTRAARSSIAASAVAQRGSFGRNRSTVRAP